MLDFLKSLFGFTSKEKTLDHFKLFTPDNGEAITVPNSTIRYHTKLIKNYKEEHQLLLKYYTQVLEALNEKDCHLAEQRVGNFIKQLKHHINSENTQLYIYLKDIHSMSPDEVHYIQDMQKKMAGIFTAVSEIVSRYPTVTTSNIQRLEKDFTALATILTERIANEESKLYELYTAPVL